MMDEDGVEFYRNLMETFRNISNVSIIAEIYHHDLPQSIQDMGGWEDDMIIDQFKNHAMSCFDNYGDLVEHWITIASPLEEVIK